MVNGNEQIGPIPFYKVKRLGGAPGFSEHSLGLRLPSVDCWGTALADMFLPFSVSEPSLSQRRVAARRQGQQQADPPCGFCTCLPICFPP